MFICEQLIGEIHAEYLARTGQDIPIELGNLEKAKNADCPRIVWTLTGGLFGTTTKIGGPDGVQAQALATFEIWFWFETLELTWNAMANLMAAIRATAYGPNVGYQNFKCPTEIDGKHSERGEAFILTCTLSVPIRIDGTIPATEVAIESVTTDVKLRSDLNALETDPVPGPDIELVIVTNP